MHICRIVLGLAVIGVVGLSSGRADVVILKDGFILQGRVGQETDLIFDKDAGVIPVAKGFFMVDDDVRRVIFPSKLIPGAQAIQNKETLKGPGVEMLQTRHVRLNSLKMEGLGLVTEITPWNENWERTLTFQTTLGPERVKQKLRFLSPHAALVEADRYRWAACYLTKELGVQQVKRLLYDHPDLRDKNGQADPDRRLRIFRFLMQAGWFEDAEQELNLLLKDAPAVKERVEEARKTLRRFQAQAFYDDLERGSKAGRHDWVAKLIERFPKDAADELVQGQFRTLQQKYEEAHAAIAAARKYLAALPAMTSPAEHQKEFTEAAAAILAELNVDNHDRLTRFLEFARQAERQRQQGMVPREGPNELLALAVSGWLVGGVAADADADHAIKLWQTRKLIRAYQVTHNEGGRQALLLQIDKLGVKFDVIALMIRTLPPAEPEAKLPSQPTEMKTKLPNRAGGSSYWLHLPKEYHLGRPYPLLIVLGPGTETAQNTLNRWADQAEKHGFILAAVDWTLGGQRQAYGYTAEEHALVLDAIQDIQRRFNVDADRIGLAGVSQGAAMAYDIGLSHPDRFAGIVPICGQPKNFAGAYTSNGLHLPFYVICGDLAPADYPKAIRRQFETWATRAHPALYVEYKGRGLEWYDGELPYLFDWLSRKERGNPIPETAEYAGMRPGDNRFYWLSGDGMHERHFNNAEKWSYRITPATLWGKIEANNQIRILTRGYKQVSVWLGPNMIDWTAPVSISVNTGSRLRDRKLTPSLATMLEDFYQRGDRQRLYFLKLDFGL